MGDVAALHYHRASLALSVRPQSHYERRTLTICGPRTFITSPSAVRKAVSPPTISVQSLSIVTHTNG